MPSGWDGGDESFASFCAAIKADQTCASRIFSWALCSLALLITAFDALIAYGDICAICSANFIDSSRSSFESNFWFAKPISTASLASTIVRQQPPVSSLSTDSSLFDTTIVSATESQGSYESLPTTIRPPPTLASTIVSRDIARSENESDETSSIVSSAVGIEEIERRISGAGGITGVERVNRQIDLANMRNNQLKQDANTQLQRHQAGRSVDLVESGLRNLERDIDNYIRTAGRNIPVNSQLSQRDNPSSLAQDETPTPVQAEFRSVVERADSLLTQTCSLI